MFREVPALPVVVPLAALSLVAVLWHLHRRGRLSAARATVALALCVYLAGIVANTVFPIFLDKPRSGTAALDLTPLAGYEPGDAVMNVVVFLPLGVILPLVLSRPSARPVLTAAAATSATIEVSQLVTSRFLGGGHVADVNDLVFNVLGSALGLSLLSVALRVPGAAARLDRFRWHSAPDAPATQ